MHVTAYLNAPAKHEAGPIAVLCGKDAYLKHAGFTALTESMLDGEDDDAGLVQFAGNAVEFVTVADELRTVSMWGDQRLVAINDADDFVSRNRGRLEKYLERPSKKSVLVLLVKSWPKTTRLAQATAKVGLTLECDQLKGAQLIRWLTDTAAAEHGKTLRADAARMLVELAGDNTAAVTSDLSMMGVTKSVTLDVTFNKVGTFPWDESTEVVGFSASGTVDRTDFGMMFGVGSLGTDVQINLEVEAAEVK